MSGYSVYRLEQGSPVLVGTLGELGDAFSYDPGYLARADAKPLSLSLPLREGKFGPVEIRPYFEGLLAEGQTRVALAAQLGLAEEDWLGLLVACGRECIGDVLICDSARLPRESGDGYVPLDAGELRGMFLSDAETAPSAPDGCVPLASRRVRTSSRQAICATFPRSSTSVCPPRRSVG